MSPRIPKGSQKETKWSPKGTKESPKGAEGSQKGTQREPKGAQREPKGAQREPKGSQRATKMEPKTDPGAMSEKDHQNVTKITSKMDHFGSQFPLKIDEKINVKIDAEKVMKKKKTRCQNVMKIN